MNGNPKFFKRQLLYLHLNLVMPPGTNASILGGVGTGLMFLGKALIFMVGFVHPLGMIARKEKSVCQRERRRELEWLVILTKKMCVWLHLRLQFLYSQIHS